MAEYVKNHRGYTNSVSVEKPVADGVTIEDGDFVYDSSGRITNASIAGQRLLGVARVGDSADLDRSYSSSVTGDTAGDVKVLVNVEPEAVYLVDTDEGTGTFDVNSEGKYFDLEVNSGVQEVNIESQSATDGQLYCHKHDPGIRGKGSTYGLFSIAEPQREL